MSDPFRSPAVNAVDPNTGLCLGCQPESTDKHFLCNLDCACTGACECPNSVRFGIVRGEPLPEQPAP